MEAVLGTAMGSFKGQLRSRRVARSDSFPSTSRSARRDFHVLRSTWRDAITLQDRITTTLLAPTRTSSHADRQSLPRRMSFSTIVFIPALCRRELIREPSV